MDSSLIGELLLKARKDRNDVLIMTNCNFNITVHPHNDFEFRKDSLVLRNIRISLDAISVVRIIPVININHNQEEKEDDDYYVPSKRSMRLIG